MRSSPFCRTCIAQRRIKQRLTIYAARLKVTPATVIRDVERWVALARNVRNLDRSARKRCVVDSKPFRLARSDRITAAGVTLSRVVWIERRCLMQRWAMQVPQKGPEPISISQSSAYC